MVSYGLLLDEHLSLKYHLGELSKKWLEYVESFSQFELYCHWMFHSACTVLCFCLPYNMVLLFGVRHMHHTLNLFSGYGRKPSELSHFSLACHPPSLSSKILKLLKLSDIFELSLVTFVFDSFKNTSPECFHYFSVCNSSVHQYCSKI